jgi:pimeloyl-ACP methyl ester carboxylesterase
VGLPTIPVSPSANARICIFAAFMPDAGEHLGTLQSLEPNPALAGAVDVSADRRLTLAPEFVGPGLYGDCDDSTLGWASARLRPMLSETTEAVRSAAWRTIPSTYVICAQDRVILPSLQRRMAKRATRVVEWDTSHSPFASQPHLVAELIVVLASQH